MKPVISTIRITRFNKMMGWKVYIDGWKYPRKPLTFYEVKSEAEAIRKAIKEAGLEAENL